MSGRAWLDALVAAGATRATRQPEASAGRADLVESLESGTELVEGATLETHDVPAGAWRPAAAAFLDGIQQWSVVGYDGVVPIVRAWVAAAVRRRGPDRRLVTTGEAGHEIVVASLERLRPAVRVVVEQAGLDVRDVPADRATPPAQALAAARLAVEAERVRVERLAGERWARQAGDDEWLVVDGVLSDHARLAEHPRALGVVKSHGAQYFTGVDLERALTVGVGRRTGVFRPAARGSGAVFAWYLRLWPWEGRDLLFGLVRLEARAAAATVARAGALSAWLLAERAPLSAPDPRWDRLLYPLRDVETYLRARAPRDFAAPAPGRLWARPA
jgi:hypothetical protein